jgi:hypothetical protein
MDAPSQGQTIQGTGHVYVGEDDAYVGARREHAQSLIGVASLDHAKSRALERVGAHHPHERLVLDNENNRQKSFLRLSHAPSTMRFNIGSPTLSFW